MVPQKVEEGMIVEKTVAKDHYLKKHFLADPHNGKTVRGLADKDTVNKTLEDLDQELKTCGKVYVQTVC